MSHERPTVAELVRRPPLTTAAMAELTPPALFSLMGQVALVTGAGGEIGGWLAAGLAAAGARVCLVDLDVDGLRRVERTLSEAGAEVSVLRADLAAPDTPERCVAHATRELGGLDVLVNCAAINRREPILEVPPESLDRILAVDLRAPYLLAQAAARAMIAAGSGGSIVNIGSITVAMGLENVSVYGMAKAGLSQLTRTMAVEWSRHGIRANCLCPGFMMTALSEPVWHEASRREWLLGRIPQRRPGLPGELVGLLLLLAGPAGAYVNGQTLHVDGGFLAGSRWDTGPS